jgi:hypothetical protein
MSLMDGTAQTLPGSPGVSSRMNCGFFLAAKGDKMNRPGDQEEIRGDGILRSHRPANHSGGSYGMLASESSVKFTCIALTAIVLFTLNVIGSHSSSVP